MLSEWVSGDRITLERNPNYWGDAAKLESVTWREVPDASTRLIAVQTGEAQLALGVSVADLPVAVADPNVNVLRRQTLATDYLGFNCTAPYLENVLVRQAIAYALDTALIFEAVWGEVGFPPAGPLSSIVWGYADIEQYTQNLDRSRELLAEAGYPNGFSTTIWWNTGNPQRQTVAEIVAASLREINIDVEVQAHEWSAILSATERGEHDMFIMGWVSVTGDADYGLYPLFHSSMHGPNNRSFFSYEPLDELLDAGRQSVVPEERLQIYHDAQQIVRDQAPWIFLRQGEEIVVTAINLAGFVINPGGHHNYTNVFFE
jgi:peptide/nickel transport system substrate-binding protein